MVVLGFIGLLREATVLEFIGLLREATKVFSKNGKLMASITFLTLLINSFIFLVYFFSMKLMIGDLTTDLNLLHLTKPTSPEYAAVLINLKHDLGFFFGFEWIYIFVTSLAALFLVTLTVLASAVTYSGGRDSISCKDFVIKAAKSWKRPFLTWVYATLIGAGYLFVVLAVLAPFQLIIQNRIASLAVVGLVTLFASVLYIYLTVVFTLAIVVSIIEDLDGIEALGKAAKIVKGSKLQGFVLNLSFIILSCLIWLGLSSIVVGKSMAAILAVSLVLICLMGVIRVGWLVAFTVFYFQCKKIHGEQVEVLESVNYTKIPTTPLMDEESIIR